MRISDLTNQSQQFKKDADRLLKKSGIVSILEPYGQVQFTGSYEHNLMLSGDIDVYVVNVKITKKLAVQALNQLIDQGFFRGYLFYDFEKFDLDDSRIKGYYVGLKIPWQDKKWKIDVWFIKQELEHDRQLRKKMRSLSAKQRLQILQLKHVRSEQSLDVDGYTIYQAVLGHNIKNISEFLKFIK